MTGREEGAAPLRREDSEVATTLHLSGEEGGSWLSLELMQALLREIEALRGTGRILVLRGSPAGFCRGMALETLTNWPEGESTRPLHQTFQTVLHALQSYDRATVAVVEGDAFGGGVALAAACDFVVAHESARFALPELLWGLLPANAAPYVVGRMGIGAARRMTLLTEPITASDAHAQGLVDFVTEAGPKMEGLLRRLALRSKRLPDDSVSAVRDLFQTLQNAPDQYDRYATDTMTRLTDDPAFRRALSEKLKQLMEP